MARPEAFGTHGHNNAGGSSFRNAVLLKLEAFRPNSEARKLLLLSSVTAFVYDLICYCHDMEGCNLDQLFFRLVCTLQVVEMPTAYAAANENMAWLDDFLTVSDIGFGVPVKRSTVLWIDGLSQFTHCRPFQISHEVNSKH